MSEERRTCPECGTGEGPDGAPSCACEPEAFAPLRVRPYVSLSEPSQPTPPRAADPYAYPPPPPHAAGDDADDDPAPDEAGPARPDAATLRGHGRAERGDPGHGADHIAGRRRRLGLGQHGRDGDSDDTHPVPLGASHHTLRVPVGDGPHVRPALPSHSRTITPSPTPTSKKPESDSKKRSKSPSPSTSRTTSSSKPTDTTTLRKGDSGREVAELQWRLKQLNIYVGEITADFDSPTETALGTYQLSRGIKTDEQGEYGPATRTALERETGGERGPEHG